MTAAPNGQPVNGWHGWEEKQERPRETRRRRIREMIRECLGDPPRVAFRPFKTLVLTDGQKKAIRHTREFRRFRALVSDSGSTQCLSNDCRAEGRGKIKVEIAATHPVTADRAKFSATVTGDGTVIEAETLDDEAIDAEADRALAG